MKHHIILVACLAATTSLNAENIARPIELKSGGKTTLLFNNATEGDCTVHLHLLKGNASVSISSGTNHVANTLAVSAGTPVTFQAHWVVIEAGAAETHGGTTEAKATHPDAATGGNREGTVGSAPPSLPEADDRPKASPAAGLSGGTSREPVEGVLGFYQIETVKTPAKDAPAAAPAPAGAKDVATLKAELEEANKKYQEALTSERAANEEVKKNPGDEAKKKKAEEAAGNVNTALGKVNAAKKALEDAEKKN